MEREEKITPTKAKGVTNNTVGLLQNIHAAIQHIKVSQLFAVVLFSTHFDGSVEFVCKEISCILMILL